MKPRKLAAPHLGFGVLTALSLATVAPQLLAKEADESLQAMTKRLSSQDLDLTPPDLSAFALLGINPSQVTRPGTVREFSAAVLNGVRSDGTITPGVAIEWSPITTWTPNTLDDYRKNVVWRRITVSAATAADGTATRVATGARWVIKDDTDPLTNVALQHDLEGALEGLDETNLLTPFQQKVANALAARPALSSQLPDLMQLFDPTLEQGKLPADKLCDALKAKALPGSPTADDNRLLCELGLDYTMFRSALDERRSRNRAAAEAIITARKSEARQNSWNASTAQVGAGVVGRSDDSTWKNLDVERFRAFMNATMGFGSTAQLIGQADLTKAFLDEKNWAFGFGARFVVGSADFSGSGEAYVQFPEEGDKSYAASGGGQLRLAKNIWLEFQVGAEKSAEVPGPAGMITRANIKYGSNAAHE